MKVFFSGARNALAEYGEIYNRIIKLLEARNIVVHNDASILNNFDVFKLDDEDKKKIYREMIKKMDGADFSVFEASWPSTIHTGHKITLCIWKTKPVIALYKFGHEPIMFKGIKNKKVIWVEYNDNNLEEKLVEAIEKAKKMLDLRLNLFISGRLMTYLNWVTKDIGANKSEYIRMLIEKEIKKR